MARRKTNTEDGQGDNLSENEKRRIIKQAADEIIRLKGERSEIQEAMTAQRAKVKALNVKMTDFNVALRMRELEAEDREQSIDGLRLCFESLDIGQQGDLFPEADASPKSKRGGVGEAVSAATH